VSSVRRSRAVIHLGLDVHKVLISAAILRPRDEIADVVRISSDLDTVAHLLERFPIPDGCGPATRPARPAMSCIGS